MSFSRKFAFLTHESIKNPFRFQARGFHYVYYQFLKNCTIEGFIWGAFHISSKFSICFEDVYFDTNCKRIAENFLVLKLTIFVLICICNNEYFNSSISPSPHDSRSDSAINRQHFPSVVHYTSIFLTFCVYRLHAVIQWRGIKQLNDIHSFRFHRSLFDE